MAIKVRGVKESVDRLNEIINDVCGRRATRAIQSSMIVGATQAALYTPIDASALLNSQFREIIVNGTLLTGRVGYTANYAHYVADPNITMKFRRATAKKDFLNKGFEETARLRAEIIRKELSL